LRGLLQGVGQSPLPLQTKIQSTANAHYEEHTQDPWTAEHKQSELAGIITEAKIQQYKDAGISLRVNLTEIPVRDPNKKYPNPMGTEQPASTLAAMARHAARDKALNETTEA
jgi:hypothetical protein